MFVDNIFPFNPEGKSHKLLHGLSEGKGWVYFNSSQAQSSTMVLLFFRRSLELVGRREASDKTRLSQLACLGGQFEARAARTEHSTRH